jgi:hypothetical protein
MVEMSVLLGINSRGLEIGHKKRARVPRVPRAKSAVTLARAWSLEQIYQRRKGLKAGINRQLAALRGLRPATKRRGLEAQPGFEPG